MKHTSKNSSLDGELKELHKQMKWDACRKQKVKNNLNRMIDETVNQRQREKNNWLKRALVPVASGLLIMTTIFILFLSEFSAPISQPENNHSNTKQTSEPQHSIDIPDEEANQIKEIEQKGFLLVIPHNIPFENVSLKNIKYKQTDEGMVVYTTYYQNEHELFSMHQEKISPSKEIDSSMIDDEAEKLDVQGIEAYFTNNGVKRKVLLLTDAYSLEISSYECTKEQLISILESTSLNQLLPDQ